MRWLLLVLTVGVFVPASANAQVRTPRLTAGSNYSIESSENVLGGFAFGAQKQGIVIQPAGVAVAPMGTSPQPFVRHRTTWGLVIPGIVAFAVSYVTSLFVTGFAQALTTGPERQYLDWGYVPLIGPFVQATADTGWLTYGLIDGFVQVAGVALLIIGFVGHDEVETGYITGNQQGPTLRGLVPFVSGQSSGLAAHGTF